MFPVLGTAQTTDYSIPQVKDSLISQFDKVQDFAVKVRVDMNMPGFRMPRKMVEVLYKKPDKFKVESASFAIVPKTGLLLSPEKIFNSMSEMKIVSTDSGKIKIQGGFNPDSAKMEMGASDMQDLKQKMQIRVTINPERWVITRMQTYADTVAFMTMHSTYTQVAPNIWLPEKTRLTFNVPSNLPGWMIIIGSLVAIGMAKMSFGGLGKNVFNPALVARVFLLISFPVQMTSWPVPKPITEGLADVITGPTPLATVKEGLKAGETMSELKSQLPGNLDYLYGQMGGSLGEVSALALILGGIYMLWKKIITWHIPVSMLGTVVIFTGILWGFDPQHFADPVFHLLTGGMMLGAIFMATDMVSSPMTKSGQLIYGFGIGVLTVLIRVWGAYPEGVSFAILLMNAVTPLINRGFKPKRFGVKQVIVN